MGATWEKYWSKQDWKSAVQSPDPTAQCPVLKGSVLSALLPVTCISFLNGSHSFVKFSRSSITLACLTCSFYYSPRFSFTVACIGLSGSFALPESSTKASPATCCLTSVALRNHGIRFYDLFTLPSLCLQSQHHVNSTAKLCCQLRMGPAPLSSVSSSAVIQLFSRSRQCLQPSFTSLKVDTCSEGSLLLKASPNVTKLTSFSTRLICNIVEWMLVFFSLNCYILEYLSL